MLFIASFRLFCNTVSTEDWDRKKCKTAKRNYIFQATRFTYYGRWVKLSMHSDVPAFDFRICFVNA